MTVAEIISHHTLFDYEIIYENQDGVIIAKGNAPYLIPINKLSQMEVYRIIIQRKKAIITVVTDTNDACKESEDTE